MEVGPPGSPCRRRSQTASVSCRLRAGVGSDWGKVPLSAGQVSDEKTNMCKPLLTQCAVNAVAVVHCRGDAVQEMEEGALLPGPPGPTQRERGTKPLQGASVKSRGLERCRKRRRNLRQVCTTKMSESEPADDAPKSGMSTSEPGACVNPGTSLEGRSRSWPDGVRRKGGMSVVWALGWNSGTSRAVVPLATGGTGVRRGRKPKARVPDAVHWGGLGCSSDEGLVMRLERRPRASCWTVGQSGNREEPFSSCRSSKPDESRGSRPVCRERGGAVPPRHPPRKAY